jgi:hypothetical protein
MMALLFSPLSFTFTHFLFFIHKPNRGSEDGGLSFSSRQTPVFGQCSRYHLFGSPTSRLRLERSDSSFYC